MSEHISTNYNSAPLNDVEMEDFSEITNALVAAIPTNAPDNVGEGVQVTDFAYSLAINASTKDAGQDTCDSVHDLTDATPAAQATVPTLLDDPAEQTPTPRQPDHSADDVAVPNPRSELFANMFSPQTIELKNFTPPSECAQYPENQEEILNAYFRKTCLCVKIWMNFDPTEQVFFEGPRAADCGKLQVPKKKLDWLLGLDQHLYNFDHIRLDIGTPFRTLANVFLDVRYQGDDLASVEVRGKVVKQHPPVQMDPVREYVGECIHLISRAEMDRSLDVEDLVGIARLFCRRPSVDDDADWEQPAYGGGQWAGIEEPSWLLRNSGSRWAVE